ncbi:hypothetical protein [Microbispora sp. CA-102843]|uniref:hypothetical protein n=1 Tax=Microbispora sp. CA-102843 TaxID=3239952 RepID=UPI003D90131F
MCLTPAPPPEWARAVRRERGARAAPSPYAPVPVRPRTASPAATWPPDSCGDHGTTRARPQPRGAVPLNLPDGTRFGTLRLRRSPECDTAWASAYFDDPRLYTVWLAAHRPADNAQVRSQWSNNTPPGSYGDLLSLARGCVWVEGWVVTEQGEGLHAKARCAR